MKTCPKCNAQVEDNAKFCMHCGAKIETKQATTKICLSCGTEMPVEANFCPACATPQNEAPETNSTPGIYDDVDLREIKIRCGYGYETNQTVVGEVVITPFGLVFESKASGFTGIMTSIATLGQKTKMGIAFKDITHMSIRDKGYILYISTEDGATHCFSGPTLLSYSENKSCVKKIGCIAELYRRMYWYYGKYEDGPYLSIYKPVGYYKDADMRFDTLTDEELMNYFKRI